MYCTFILIITFLQNNSVLANLDFNSLVSINGSLSLKVRIS